MLRGRQLYSIRHEAKRIPCLISSYIKNWPATRPAVMIILGPRPAKRPLNPASRPRVIRREVMDPEGPCPLLIYKTIVQKTVADGANGMVT